MMCIDIYVYPLLHTDGLYSGGSGQCKVTSGRARLDAHTHFVQTLFMQVHFPWCIAKHRGLPRIYILQHNLKQLVIGPLFSSNLSSCNIFVLLDTR